MPESSLGLHSCFPDFGEINAKVPDSRQILIQCQIVTLDSGYNLRLGDA